jgi:hypothetical protein
MEVQIHVKIIWFKVRAKCGWPRVITVLWPVWSKYSRVTNLNRINIVTYKPFARQWLGKNFPVEAYARNSKTSFARQRISKPAFLTIDRMCFLRGPCRGIIKGQRRSSLRNWQLQNDGKKGLRLWQEDFLCNFELQWDCDESVARIRLKKTENRSACVTVNCKVCKSAIALYYL